MEHKFETHGQPGALIERVCSNCGVNYNPSIKGKREEAESKECTGNILIIKQSDFENGAEIDCGRYGEGEVRFRLSIRKANYNNIDDEYEAYQHYPKATGEKKNVVIKTGPLEEIVNYINKNYEPKQRVVV